jgi:hypothetical protein
MPRETDLANHPGFCSSCYCEKCERGFYTAVKGAVKLKNGSYVCSENGCPGLVKGNPTLNFQRLSPCKGACSAPKTEAAA